MNCPPHILRAKALVAERALDVFSVSLVLTGASVCGERGRGGGALCAARKAGSNSPLAHG